MTTAALAEITLLLLGSAAARLFLRRRPPGPGDRPSYESGWGDGP